MADYEKVKALAAELSRGFEDVMDGDKALIRDHCRVRSLNDAARERFQDVCHAAHGDMMPDDWRYSMIEEAADLIAKSDDESEYQDRISETEAPVYNAELLGWVGSRADRGGYVDDAVGDYGPADNFYQGLARGWHVEFREVADQLYRALDDMADALGAVNKSKPAHDPKQN